MAKLGQLLVARGWITVQQLTRALKNQNVAGGRLGTCLLEMDALSEELLLKGLAEQHGVPAAGADDLRRIPDEVLELIPDKLARRLRSVPFRVESSRLDLAVTDPRNLSAQDEIAFASGKRVKVFVAPEIRILEALEKYYGEECPSRFGMVLDRLNRARFLWEKDKPAVAPQPELTQPLLDSPFATPPRIKLPPHLPQVPPPPPVAAAPQPTSEPAIPARPVPPAVQPPAPARQPAPAPVPRAAAAVATAPTTAPAPTPPPPPVAAAAPRPRAVSLTPEGRAGLGAFPWGAPAADDRSLPAAARPPPPRPHLGGRPPPRLRHAAGARPGAHGPGALRRRRHRGRHLAAPRPASDRRRHRRRGALHPRPQARRRGQGLTEFPFVDTSQDRLLDSPPLRSCNED